MFIRLLNADGQEAAYCTGVVKKESQERTAAKLDQLRSQISRRIAKNTNKSALVPKNESREKIFFIISLPTN